jgi:hypothetical protein
MSKTNATVIYERPADPVSTNDFLGESMIDPMSIFGFPILSAGEPPVITDHPDFPNPRTGPMDRQLINEIKAAGVLLEPITIYFHEEDGEEIPILVNGKTRLTAVAEAWAENPTTDAFRLIPFTVVTGTPMEVKFLQAKLNLEDTRRPLSAVETADFLMRMEAEYGLTEEQQLEYLKKPVNQGTIRWLREAKQVASDPIARTALEEGKIDMTTAKGVAKTKGEEAKKEAVEKIVEEKAKGKTERQARQAVTVRKETGKGEVETSLRGGNKTTLGWKPTVELMKEYYPYAKLAHQRNVDPDKVNWMDKTQREDYLFDQEIIARYDMIVKFMKLDHLSLREQFVEIESIFGKEECEIMKVIAWMPEDTSTKKTQAPAPKTKAPATRSSTKSKSSVKAKASATKPSAKTKAPAKKSAKSPL